MGLLEKIFFRDWPRPLETRSAPELNLDLVSKSLGPFTIDKSAESLKERLGPPASWRLWKKQQRWHYPELGVWFESSKDGALERINVIVREEASYPICPGWTERWKPWTGSIRFPSGDTVLAPATKLDDFIKFAGEPDDRYDNEEEHELYYCEEPRFCDYGFDVDFTIAGGLSALDLYSQRE